MRRRFSSTVEICVSPYDGTITPEEGDKDFAEIERVMMYDSPMTIDPGITAFPQMPGLTMHDAKACAALSSVLSLGKGIHQNDKTGIQVPSGKKDHRTGIWIPVIISSGLTTRGSF
jgi:hypothetical protein